MRTFIINSLLSLALGIASAIPVQAYKYDLKWDAQSLLINGKRVYPVGKLFI